MMLISTPDNQGTDTRRGAGIMLLNLVGQCGPLLGTNIYPSSESPRYVRGMSICAGFLFFTALLALTLRTLLAWENRKLDKLHLPDGRGETETRDEECDRVSEVAVAAENYGATFRYIL